MEGEVCRDQVCLDSEAETQYLQVISTDHHCVHVLILPCRTSAKCSPTWYYQRLNLAQVLFSATYMTHPFGEVIVSVCLCVWRLGNKRILSLLKDRFDPKWTSSRFQAQSDAWSEKSLWAPSSSPAWVKVLRSRHCQIHVLQYACEIMCTLQFLKEIWPILTLWTRPWCGCTQTIR